MSPPLRLAANGGEAATGSESPVASVFTVIVEYHPDAEKPWAASVHRQDGSMLAAFAGDSAFDVMSEAAKVSDKEVTK